jgi:hypothetical protein
VKTRDVALGGLKKLKPFYVPQGCLGTSNHIDKIFVEQKKKFCLLNFAPTRNVVLALLSSPALRYQSGRGERNKIEKKRRKTLFNKNKRREIPKT